MDIKDYIRFRKSLKNIVDIIERIDEATEKEMKEAAEDWTKQSEYLVHQLCLKKLEQRRAEVSKVRDQFID